MIQRRFRRRLIVKHKCVPRNAIYEALLRFLVVSRAGNRARPVPFTLQGKSKPERSLLMKNTLIKVAATVGMIASLAVASAIPSQARNGVGAFAAGAAVGALGGAAIASGAYGGYPAYGYGPGYSAYGDPGYAYYGGWHHRHHRHWGYYR
jgi:hypothetical protein